MKKITYILAVECDGPENCLIEFNDPADLMNFIMDIQDKGCINPMALAVLD